MSIINKVFDVMGFVEPQDDEQMDAQQDLPRQSQPMAERKPAESRPTVSGRNGNLIPMQPREPVVVTSNHSGSSSARVVLNEPVSFDETQRMADSLLKGRLVLINIENCDADIAAKIIDFIGGVVYAINGSIKRVSQGIIVAAPENINIDSELKQDMANDTEVFDWVQSYNNRGDF